MESTQSLRKVDVLSPTDVERRSLAPAVAGSPREYERPVRCALAFRSVAQDILSASDDP